MPFTFSSEQWLPYPVELVFAFFANPENLPRLMPTWQKARIEEADFAPPPPRPLAPDPALRFKSIAAGAGTRMTFSFRPFPYAPIRVPWEAEISEFAWNDHFCDIQLRGPFASWKHCHRLRPETRGDNSGGLIHGTMLRDEVEYTMHFGRLGEIAQRLFISRQIQSIFNYRQTRTLELLPMLRAVRQSPVAR
jgi:ligand-binding SRPBCC domain-containing protein